MNGREKTYTIVIVVLLVILAAKSLVLDNYKPGTEDEKLFYNYASEIAQEEYTNFLYKNHIATYKIVGIKKLEDEGVSVLESVVNGKKELVEIQGKYKAKIRKYILWVLPFSEDKIMSRK